MGIHINLTFNPPVWVLGLCAVVLAFSVMWVALRPEIRSLYFYLVVRNKLLTRDQLGMMGYVTPVVNDAVARPTSTTVGGNASADGRSP